MNLAAFWPPYIPSLDSQPGWRQPPDGRGDPRGLARHLRALWTRTRRERTAVARAAALLRAHRMRAVGAMGDAALRVEAQGVAGSGTATRAPRSAGPSRAQAARFGRWTERGPRMRRITSVACSWPSVAWVERRGFGEGDLPIVRRRARQLFDLIRERSQEVPADIRSANSLSCLLEKRNGEFDLTDGRPHDCAACLAKSGLGE